MATKITYIGPLKSTSIEVGKSWVEVTHGETIEVPDEAAYGDGTDGAGLLAQTDIWRGPKAAKKPAKKSAPRKPRATKKAPAPAGPPADPATTVQEA